MITTQHDRDYSGLLRAVKTRFSSARGQLFCTDASGLFETYLDNLPPELRQVHNCNTCKKFIEDFGGLVEIDEGGITFSVLWGADEIEKVYDEAFRAMLLKVESAKVTGPFISDRPVLGRPVTGPWTHLSVEVKPNTSRLHTAAALTASAKENFQAVKRALSEYTPRTLDEALRVLKAAVLTRSDKFIGPVAWLRKLQDRPKGPRGDNILWSMIATAPEGYCHPRASVVGSLLDDIQAGKSFETVKNRFNEKVNPRIYQRPQAAPSAGNIEAAEKAFAKLGLEKSLERRFARLDEVQAFWRPSPIEPSRPAGLFGHLRPENQDTASLKLPPRVMTWVKFRETILPEAKTLQFKVPNTGSFAAMTTAVHADAPGILKWPGSVAWYLYMLPSPANQWNLVTEWAEVLAISLKPCHWAGTFPGFDPFPFLILKGASDNKRNSGNALFPEILKNDLHAYRSTIEAYSKAAQFGEVEGQHAAGYTMTVAMKLRVNGSEDIIIDRMD